jgi:oxygen-independent coproporphyrinogen III oxidase
MSQMTTAGLYIHIPFCRHRCGYCAFAISTLGHGDHQVQSNYLSALKSELKMRVQRHGPIVFDTLYVGGGTPSRLQPDLIEDLGNWLQETELIKSKESTFEVNPEDLLEQPNLSQTIQDAGFNRVSLGIQTLSPNGLKVLERRADPKGISDALQLLTLSSKQLSFDFILGWPGQTIEDVENDLAFIKTHRPGHISAYILNLEPGTRLTKKVEMDISLKPDDDQTGQHWDHFRQSLINSGYLNYEISSFSLPGLQSQHNRSTWKGNPYLGLGSGAVSRIGQTRWTNHKTPKKYLEAIANRRWPVVYAEYTGKDVAWQEALLLGCRHDEGLSLSELASYFRTPLPDILFNSIRLGVECGDLIKTPDRLCFTPRGWARFDAWISDWMLILEKLELNN